MIHLYELDLASPIARLHNVRLVALLAREAQIALLRDLLTGHLELADRLTRETTVVTGTDAVTTQLRTDLATALERACGALLGGCDLVLLVLVAVRAEAS